MIDLHTHSTFSDGSFTPEQLVHEAVFAGLTAVALTDHDSIEGVGLFMQACEKSGIRGVPGVEISADYPNGSMHILGYFIDIKDKNLRHSLGEIRASRNARNEQIIKQLAEFGIVLTMPEVAAYAGGDNIGRLHFSQALVARGYVKTRQEAFDRYLAKGRNSYVNRMHLTPRDSIDMIRQAGGIAVLAHPFTLNLGKAQLESLVTELAGYGLQGIEVIYPQQKPRLLKQYKALAQRLDLVQTGGTDFHGAPMPEIKLGSGFGNLEVPDNVLEQLDAIQSQ